MTAGKPGIAQHCEMFFLLAGDDVLGNVILAGSFTRIPRRECRQARMPALPGSFILIFFRHPDQSFLRLAEMARSTLPGI
jgi:hypothetical protein